MLGCSNVRHRHWIYLILIFSPSIGKQVFPTVLNLSVTNYAVCASFLIFTWHENDCGIISTRGFQLVYKRVGTNRYIHIVQLE